MSTKGPGGKYVKLTLEDMEDMKDNLLKLVEASFSKLSQQQTEKNQKFHCWWGKLLITPSKTALSGVL